MRNLITASALGLVMATPLAANAQQNANSELEALKQQLQVLTQKVQELEAKQAETAQKTEKVEERVAGVESTNDNQTDQLAKTSSKVTSADWASRIKLKGDFRYRHENIDQEAAVTRDRERIALSPRNGRQDQRHSELRLPARNRRYRRPAVDQLDLGRQWRQYPQVDGTRPGIR